LRVLQHYRRGAVPELCEPPVTHHTEIYAPRAPA
jgi:hypothetical protein